jgi:hypothetical protein
MTDFFADLEGHLLDAARRERRPRPRPRPRVVLAVTAAAAAAVLLISVLPQALQERGSAGGVPPADLDGWTSYVPLSDCAKGPINVVTDETPPQLLSNAIELFRQQPPDPLPGEVMTALARMGADEIQVGAAREVRGPDYSRVWLVPVGRVALPSGCDARSTPAVCIVASDGDDPSCVLGHVFIKSGFTQLFFDPARPPVVVGLVPNGVVEVLLRAGEQEFELPVRTNVFAATLDGAGSDVGGVEDLDIRWRMADGSVAPAVTP